VDEDRLDDLHAEVTALTLMLGIMLASDPRRKELVQAYRGSLALLDEHPEWQTLAERVREYGETLVESFQPDDAPRPS
jgi:hypothetical protein